MVQTEGFITAGGNSSRMGIDKAWLDIDGQPLIERVISAMRPVLREISIIANSDAYEELGLPVYRDRNSGIGPLEAIRTALSNASRARVLLVSCDMPFLTSEFLSFLLDLRDGSEIIVPEDPNKMLEPLCAIYSKTTLGVVEQLISDGHRKVSDLFDRVPTRNVRFEEFSDLKDALFLFENINTPGDYQRVLRLLESQDG